MRHAIGVLCAVCLSVAAVAAAAQAYLIREGDRLAITVLEDPSLNQTVLVRPDGRISLPLAGTLMAEGRTPEQLQADIQQALARDFVAPPTVTAAVVGIAGETEGEAAAALQAIYVLGQVARPGRYDISEPTDILQLLAIAGGPTPFGATRRIQIRRRTEGGETVLLYDYEAVEDGTVPTQGVELRDGDVIVVPERGLFE